MDVEIGMKPWPHWAPYVPDEYRHAMGNLAIGWRMDNHAFLSHPEFRMNFNNITNQRYHSGVATPTPAAAGGPQYYAGGGLAVPLTAAAGF
ncbi:hypothetical protein GLUCORHAEAF1_00245 [Komagataeibacter rhaeticus AF1]|nr:hypothetical protein GLUCORHAEAF1_00245 [Komagataeibacter rhaeticus AF1]